MSAKKTFTVSVNPDAAKARESLVRAFGIVVDQLYEQLKEKP